MMDESRDQEFAKDLRDSALRTGRGHIEAARLVEMTEVADISISESENEHLAICDDCREDLEHLRELPGLAAIEDELGLSAGPTSVIEETEAAQTKRARGGQVASSWQDWLRSGWFLGAGGLAVATLAAFLILGQPGGSDEASSAEVIALAQVRPIPLRVPRSGVAEDPFSQALFGGLEAYVNGDFDTAASKLAEATGLNPDNSEAWVFRGSAELLNDTPTLAVFSLQSSMERATAPDHRHEAGWQLANAYLAGGNAEQARPLLQAIASEDGPRTAMAAQILQSLDAISGSGIP